MNLLIPLFLGLLYLVIIDKKTVMGNFIWKKKEKRINNSNTTQTLSNSTDDNCKVQKDTQFTQTNQTNQTNQSNQSNQSTYSAIIEEIFKDTISENKKKFQDILIDTNSSIDTTQKTQNQKIIELINKSKKYNELSKNSKIQLYKTLYSNYSIANLYMLKNISSSEKIKQISGESFESLLDKTYEEMITHYNHKIRYFKDDMIIDIISDSELII